MTDVHLVVKSDQLFSNTSRCTIIELGFTRGTDTTCPRWLQVEGLNYLSTKPGQVQFLEPDTRIIGNIDSHGFAGAGIAPKADYTNCSFVYYTNFYKRLAGRIPFPRFSFTKT